ncbi:MAG: reverse transcriptase family protein [Candidatus Thermoplasmatota archaeon]|nr:reverse transcriptase family protein [Candidatus Thermoplasmatota archaeon]
MNNYIEVDKNVLREFKNLKNERDVANLLQIPYNVLHYYIVINRNNNYKKFIIKKKNGEIRTIYAPISSLKILQRKLHKILSEFYKVYYRPSVYGFRDNLSIVDNARKHQDKKNIFHIDIKDFFPSISYKRVIGLLSSGIFNFPYSVSIILTKICCYQGMLPQGAPTSPILSNIICSKLDYELQLISKDNYCTYTRYSDDIVFSNTANTFPKDIATDGKCSDKLVSILLRNGFKINDSKVYLQRNIQRQVVTGLTVNQFPNVKRIYVKKIRAILHSWEKYGLKNTESIYCKKREVEKENRKEFMCSLVKVIEGKIAFLKMVKGKDNYTYLKIYKRFCDLIGREFPYHDLLNALKVEKRVMLNKYAKSIRKCIYRCNQSYAYDIFKPTNDLINSLDNLGIDARDYHRFGDRIDDLYMIFYEGTGYIERLKEHSLDRTIITEINILRTYYRHDIDHGKTNEIRRKRIKTMKVIQKYINKNSIINASELDLYIFQKKLYDNVMIFLEELEESINKNTYNNDTTGNIRRLIKEIISSLKRL